MSEELQPVAWMYSNKRREEVFSQPNRANMDPRYWREEPLYTFEQLQGFNRLDDRPLTSNQFVYHETENMRDKPTVTQADIDAVDRLMNVNIDVCPCDQCRDQYEALLASHREYGYHTGYYEAAAAIMDMINAKYASVVSESILADIEARYGGNEHTTDRPTHCA